MDTSYSHELVDFETYCSIIIEIDRINSNQIGYAADTQILTSISDITRRAENVIAKGKRIELKNEKRAILSRLLKEYEVYLRSK